MTVLKCNQLLWQLLLERKSPAMHAARRRSAAGAQTSRTCLLAQLAPAEPASLLWMTVLKRNQLQWQLLLERKSPAMHAARRRSAAGAQTSRTCLLAQLAPAEPASLLWMTILKRNQLQWQLLLERKSPAMHAARRRSAAGAQASRTCLLAQLALADAASLPWWFWSATNCCGSFCWRGRC